MSELGAMYSFNLNIPWWVPLVLLVLLLAGVVAMVLILKRKF